jgi:hypothetical protein
LSQSQTIADIGAWLAPIGAVAISYGALGGVGRPSSR